MDLPQPMGGSVGCLPGSRGETAVLVLVLVGVLGDCGGGLAVVLLQELHLLWEVPVEHLRDRPPILAVLLSSRQGPDYDRRETHLDRQWRDRL